MRKVTVGDVMTRDMITVNPDTAFKDIVDFLVGEGISAVPVVDERGDVIGVVSEADLLRKEEHVDDEESDGPSVFALPRTREHWRKAGGLTARQLMTSPVVTVSPDEYLPNAARMMAWSKVRRLFVIDNGRLVGVVSRRDLLRSFLRGDDEIRAEIERDVFRRVLWADPKSVSAAVDNGVVTLNGRLEYEADVDIAVHLVKRIPGVVSVNNNLEFRRKTDPDLTKPHSNAEPSETDSTEVERTKADRIEADTTEADRTEVNRTEVNRTVAQ
ncbi:MAG TPA: CBS domain-containing protein [Pseudonocardiaceae bacterium]